MHERVERLLQRPRLRDAYDLGCELVGEWNRDRLSGLAAEMAFFVALSVFPAMLAIGAALGFLDGLVGAELAEGAQAWVIDVLAAGVGDDSPLLDTVADLFADTSGGALTIGAVGLLLSASRGSTATIRALDVVYDVAERRPWLRLRLLGLALALLSLVVLTMLLSMLVLGPALGGGHAAADWLGLGDVFRFFWNNLRAPFALVVAVAWIVTLYRVAPNHQAPWRAQLPGGIVAAVLAIVASLGFRIYLALGMANDVLGTVGGGLVLLLWLYLLSMGVLLGGELNAVLHHRRTEAHAG